MKKILPPIVMLLLCACAASPAPMTNEQIIAETKKCTDAGLRAVPLVNGSAFSLDQRILAIQCEPKETER